MITRENYEIYFIDYIEGKLSSKEKYAVEQFLEQHPDLQEELEMMEASFVPLEKEEISLNTSFLKKKSPIHAGNEKDYLIAKLEGDLTKEEEKFVDLYLAEFPDKRKLYTSFEQTALKADTNIIFPNKNRLKKKSRVIYLYRVSSLLIAASVLFILMFYFFNSEKLNVEKSPIAEQHTKDETTLKQGGKETAEVEIVPTPLKEKKHTSKEKVRILPFESPARDLVQHISVDSDSQKKSLKMDKIDLLEPAFMAFHQNKPEIENRTFSLVEPKPVVEENEKEYTLFAYVMKKVLLETKGGKKVKEIKEEVDQNGLYAFIDKQTNGFVKIEQSNLKEKNTGFEITFANRVTIGRK